MNKDSFKDKIAQTIGAFIMLPMIYDVPGSEISKMDKWKVLKLSLKEIWRGK
jgi:hypothetical protein